MDKFKIIFVCYFNEISSFCPAMVMPQAFFCREKRRFQIFGACPDREINVLWVFMIFEAFFLLRSCRRRFFSGFLIANRAESGKGESDYRAPSLNLTIGQNVNLTTDSTGRGLRIWLGQSGKIGLRPWIGQLGAPTESDNRAAGVNRTPEKQPDERAESDREPFPLKLAFPQRWLVRIKMGHTCQIQWKVRFKGIFETIGRQVKMQKQAQATSLARWTIGQSGNRAPDSQIH